MLKASINGSLTVQRFLVKNVLARAGNIVPLAAPNGDLALP